MRNGKTFNSRNLKRFDRNRGKLSVKNKQGGKSPPKKMVTVYFDSFIYFQSGISYQCPFFSCNEKIWLESRVVSRRNMTCPFCDGEFILDVKNIV